MLLLQILLRRFSGARRGGKREMASKGAGASEPGGKSKQTGEVAERLSAISWAGAEWGKADHGGDDREAKGDSYVNRALSGVLRFPESQTFRNLRNEILDRIKEVWGFSLDGVSEPPIHIL